MKTKKKNRFLTFWVSCIPGAGEMYMGFMKMGLSMMLMFAFTILIAAWTNQGAIACFCVVEWFYCFFYANHLASLSDDEFEKVKDEYLFGLDAFPGTKNFVEKYHKWVACGLILIGISFLWSTMTEFAYRILPEEYRFIYRIMWRVGEFVPSILISCGIIFLGVKLLGGKKMEVAEEGRTIEGKVSDGDDRENQQ